MPGICVNLSSEGAGLQAYLTPLEALIVNAVEEFGQNCSILSSLDSFLEDLGIKSTVESTFRDVMKAASDLFDGINNIISTLVSIYEEGLDLLLAAIDEMYNIINDAFTTLSDIINSAASALKTALNTFTGALCKTLSGSVSDIPTSIIEGNAGVQFANYMIDQAAIMTTNAIIGNILRNQNVSNFLSSANAVRSSILNMRRLPNVSAYVCIES
jgi:phage-related protein